MHSKSLGSALIFLAVACAARPPIAVQTAPAGINSLECARTVLANRGFDVTTISAAVVRAETRQALGPARALRSVVTITDVVASQGTRELRAEMATYSYEPPPAESVVARQMVSAVTPSVETLEAGEEVIDRCGLS